MPKTVELEINLSYKPETPEQKAAYQAARDDMARRTRGGKKFRVSYVSAIEAMKNSGGIYKIAEKEPSTGQVSFVRLEDQSTEDLKMMMVQLGANQQALQKKMKRSDVIEYIRRKLSEIPVSEE